MPRAFKLCTLLGCVVLLKLFFYCVARHGRATTNIHSSLTSALMVQARRKIFNISFPFAILLTLIIREHRRRTGALLFDCPPFLAVVLCLVVL